jgi:maltose O-acetyltransferase
MKLINKISRKLLYRYETFVLRKYLKIITSISTWIYGYDCFLDRSCRFNVPVQINGNGNVTIGADVSLGYRKAPMLGNGKILLQARTPSSHIAIGAGTITSNNVTIISCESISLGQGCQIGDQVMIIDCDFHEVNPETRINSTGGISPVVIGNNVWLGSRVIILKGVQIGDHSVVAAGSIVFSSIPERSLAAGVPARVIRSL